MFFTGSENFQRFSDLPKLTFFNKVKLTEKAEIN